MIIRDERVHCAPMDYEWMGNPADRAAYEALLDPFRPTGSPSLPAGLNLGMQLFQLDAMPAGALIKSIIVP